MKFSGGASVGLAPALIILTLKITQNSKPMTNFCFEIRASSDLDEVKVPVQKSTLNRFRLNFGSCYDCAICLYFRTILFC